MMAGTPEAVWVFPPERPQRGRVWLIVLLTLLALGIVAVMLFFLLPRETNPAPSPTTTNTSAATSNPTPSPTATPTTTPTATPTPEPTETIPPVEQPAPPNEPDIADFRAQIAPWLTDAHTGLGLVSGTSGTDAVQFIDQLQQDVQRLSDAPAPDSIYDAWHAGLASYSAQLGSLRSAAEAGNDLSGPVNDAAASVDALQRIIGG